LAWGRSGAGGKARSSLKRKNRKKIAGEGGMLTLNLRETTERWREEKAGPLSRKGKPR